MLVCWGGCSKHSTWRAAWSSENGEKFNPGTERRKMPKELQKKKNFSGIISPKHHAVFQLFWLVFDPSTVQRAESFLAPSAWSSGGSGPPQAVSYIPAMPPPSCHIGISSPVAYPQIKRPRIVQSVLQKAALPFLSPLGCPIGAALLRFLFHGGKTGSSSLPGLV